MTAVEQIYKAVLSCRVVVSGSLTCTGNWWVGAGQVGGEGEEVGGVS